MEEDEALPAGWRVAQDTKGRTYYYNKQLNLKQWGRPQPPIRGFHRQASAREPSPMRQPPAIPHWGLDETTEPGLADALRPLVRELRPRLLWALADGHRQQLELVWPELGRCYRPPPPDGDFATADIGGASVRTRKKKARERLIDVVVDDRASPGGKSIIIIVFPARSRCLFHARSAQSITSRCFIRLIVTCLCGIRDRRRPATRSKRSKERKKLIHPLTSPRSSDADRPQNLSTSPKTGLLQGAGL